MRCWLGVLDHDPPATQLLSPPCSPSPSVGTRRAQTGCPPAADRGAISTMFGPLPTHPHTWSASEPKKQLPSRATSLSRNPDARRAAAKLTTCSRNACMHTHARTEVVHACDRSIVPPLRTRRFSRSRLPSALRALRSSLALIFAPSFRPLPIRNFS